MKTNQTSCSLHKTYRQKSSQRRCLAIRSIMPSSAYAEHFRQQNHSQLQIRSVIELHLKI